MQHSIRMIIVLLSILLFSFCGKSQPVVPEPENLITGHVIEWDRNTLVRIAEEGAYPRIRRIANGELLAVYENRTGDVMAKKSKDEGKTWAQEVTVYNRFEYTNAENNQTCFVNIFNPEIIHLPNGDILFACNLRPDKNEVYPFSIAIKRSKDQGATWSEPQIIYRAAPRFIDGCWEPSFLLLPNGTLQVYFANEKTYQTSNEQEISMLTSSDNGATWSETAKTVSFRQGKRDGMPVATMHNGEIFLAIEDNKAAEFKPYIVRTSVENPWQTPVLANSPNRYSALETPIPDNIYAGAPYLIRTDKGLFVLSYQTTRNRTTNWENSTMEVVVSDKPSAFKNPTYPFNVPLSKEAKWSSLVDLGNNTVAAVSSTNFDGGKIGAWMIKGTIVKK